MAFAKTSRSRCLTLLPALREYTMLLKANSKLAVSDASHDLGNSLVTSTERQKHDQFAEVRRSSQTPKGGQPISSCSSCSPHGIDWARKVLVNRHSSEAGIVSIDRMMLRVKLDGP